MLTVFTALFAVGILVLGGLLAFYWRKARSLLKENRQLEEQVDKMKDTIEKSKVASVPTTETPVAVTASATETTNVAPTTSIDIEKNLETEPAAIPEPPRGLFGLLNYFSRN